MQAWRRVFDRCHSLSGRATARDLFAELTGGMEALAEARHGKRTLRTHTVEFKPAPTVTPQELIRLRKSLKIFARLVRGLPADQPPHIGEPGTGPR